MSVEQGPPDEERRLAALLAELHETAPPAGVDLARHLVRRARRQRATLAFVQLLLVLARAVPDAIALGTGRRR